MAATGKEKRKNGARRPVQWWLLVVGFGLGALFMLAISASRGPGASGGRSIDRNSMALTATQVVLQASQTASAAGIANNGYGGLQAADPLHLTATAIVRAATEQAASGLGAETR